MEITRRCVQDILLYGNQCKEWILLVVVLICIITVAAQIVQTKKGLCSVDFHTFFYKLFVYIFDAVYLTYSFYVTFGMRYIGMRQEVKWIPFKGIWTTPWEIPLLVENILLFLPFGILAPLTFSRFRNWKMVLKSAVVCSALIEVLQYIFQCGKSETDDCILNCLGAMIGYGLFACGAYVKLFISKQNMQRKIEKELK